MVALAGEVAAGEAAARAARRSPAREGGFAMLLTLLVVFLLAVGLSLVSLSLAVQLRVARQEARSIMLTSLCDAALAEALAAIEAAGATQAVGNVNPHPFGGGTIGSEILAASASSYVVTATASYGGKSRTVQAQVTSDTSGTRVTAWARLAG